MNIAIFDDGQERSRINSMLEGQRALRFRQFACRYYDDYDDFVSALVQTNHDLVIVTVKGAGGMNGVAAAKDAWPHTNVFWFSDDENFGPMSYQLGCAYFSSKPIDEQQLDSALSRLPV